MNIKIADEIFRLQAAKGKNKIISGRWTSLLSDVVSNACVLFLLGSIVI